MVYIDGSAVDATDAWKCSIYVPSLEIYDKERVFLTTLVCGF